MGKFFYVVNKAKTSVETNILDHFSDISKMVEIGSESIREIDDIVLTRYACYFIVQNGVPRKK